MIAGTYPRSARCFLVPTASASFAFAAPAQPHPGLHETLQWEHRVLIVFSPDRMHPLLSRQRHLLDPAAIAERDVHVVEVVGETVSGVREYAGRLRQSYDVGGNSFEALLIGKDGNVKLRSTDAIEMVRLIDATPMRHREMKRREF